MRRDKTDRIQNKNQALIVEGVEAYFQTVGADKEDIST
jgi:hypothetical protein